jgi:multisubunit Na+/H+ antiporter MnhB subunit
MKSVLKKISASLLLVPAVVLGLGFAIPATAGAECDTSTMSLTNGSDCAKGDGTPTSLFADGGVFKTIVNIMLFLVGAIAVIMLIFGGIRYVTSGGAQDQVTAAKNTIMYAIIGIVVAILAYAVVNFVITGLKTS